MSWCAIYEDVADNPKTRRLARELNVSRHEAIGLLTCLWLWGLKNADEDGVLQNATNADIALGMKSDRLSADGLVDGLVLAGWIDRTSDGCLQLHDWADWQAPWYAYRKKCSKDAEAKRRKRADEREKRQSP